MICLRTYIYLPLTFALLALAAPAGAAEFTHQGAFWQLDLTVEDSAHYSVDSLTEAGVPLAVAQAADGENARNDIERVAAFEESGVTLLGSNLGGAMIIVPAGWLSAEDMAGAMGPVFAHTLGDMSLEDPRLKAMPYVEAWRESVGVFGGLPKPSHFAVVDDLGFAAAPDDRLLYTEIGSGEWHDLGIANEVVALGTLDVEPAGRDIRDRIVVATKSNVLYHRAAVIDGVTWEETGTANNVISITGVGDHYYCITIGGGFWSRPYDNHEVDWIAIGEVPSSVALAGVSGHIYYVDSVQRIYVTSPGENPVEWRRVSSDMLAPFELPE